MLGEGGRRQLLDGSPDDMRMVDLRYSCQSKHERCHEVVRTMLVVGGAPGHNPLCAVEHGDRVLQLGYQPALADAGITDNRTDSTTSCPGILHHVE